MAEIGRKKHDYKSPKRMTEFKQKSPSLVSNIRKKAEDTAKSILSGTQRAASRIATKEEAKAIGKEIQKAAHSKEAKAVGGFLNRWASLYNEEPKKKPSKQTKSSGCSCPGSGRKKMVKSTRLSKRR